MPHLSPLQLSMLADQALPTEEESSATEHLAQCDECRMRFSAYQHETRMLDATLQMEREPVAIPEFKRPLTLKGFALANLATGLVIWAAQFLWKTLFGELLMDVTARLTSVYLPDTYDLVINSVLYFIEEGTAMFDAYLAYVVLFVVTITVLGILLTVRRYQSSLGTFAVLVLAVGTLVSPPASALEVRSDDDAVLTIGADEVIDDSMVIAAQSIRIEGHVTGSIVAAAQNIDVTGRVDGNLIVVGQSLNIRGDIGGLVVGAASRMSIDGATVGGDLIFSGESLYLDADGAVGGNAIFAGASTQVDGNIGKDLYVFTELAEIRGTIGRDFEAFANRVWLLDDAHVRGDVRWRSDNEDGLRQDDSVTIGGEIEALSMPEGFEQRSPYATVEFYLWQVAQFVSAILVGLFLLWLFPSLRNLSIGSGGDTLKSAGIGLLTLVSVPMLALLVAITIVGLPFTVLGFVAWIMGLYLAKIVIGIIAGHMLLPDSDSRILPIVAGMAVMIVAVNIPFVGGVISFIITITGLGLLVLTIMDHLPRSASVA